MIPDLKILENHLSKRKQQLVLNSAIIGLLDIKKKEKGVLPPKVKPRLDKGAIILALIRS